MIKTLLLTVFSVLIVMLLSCGNPTSDAGLGTGTGTVTDIEGNTYQTVKIGDQEWMAENLRTTKYRDGSAIPHITDSAAWVNDSLGAYCYYNNTTNTDSIKKFGALYNGYAVDTEKLAPDGWHVPTGAEWDTLLNYLIANGYNWDGTTTDNKIAKSMAAKTDWDSSGAVGTPGNDIQSNNSSGFSALPGGCRDDDGNFRFQSYYGYWWSASELVGSFAYYRYLAYIYDPLSCLLDYNEYGVSVRLLRD